MDGNNGFPIMTPPTGRSVHNGCMPILVKTFTRSKCLDIDLLHDRELITHSHKARCQKQYYGELRPLYMSLWGTKNIKGYDNGSRRAT